MAVPLCCCSNTAVQLHVYMLLALQLQIAARFGAAKATVASKSECSSFCTILKIFLFLQQNTGRHFVTIFFSQLLSCCNKAVTAAVQVCSCSGNTDLQFAVSRNICIAVQLWSYDSDGNCDWFSAAALTQTQRLRVSHGFGDIDRIPVFSSLFQPEFKTKGRFLDQ